MSTMKASVGYGHRRSVRTSARHAEAPTTPSAFDDVPMEEIWEQYRANRTLELRNYLWQKYLHLVRYNAERVFMRLPDEVDVEDLMSAGMFGLMDAIDSYDPNRGVKFETFSAQRIRGAILDELRSMDWVPRLVRHRTAKVEEARRQIEAESGQKATDEQVAKRLNIDPTEFDKYLRDSDAKNVTSLSRTFFPSDGNRDLREIDVIRDDSQANPVSETQRRDLKELLTKGLSRAERLIIILYYYEGMTMKEIGGTLDLSESRVSQMHSSILLRLKSHMRHRARELEPTT